MGIQCNAAQSGRLFRYGIVLLLTCPSVQSVHSATEQTWDFRTGLNGWKGNHHVDALVQTREGITFRSTGNDPWIEGPAISLGRDRLTRVLVRMKSNANAAGELFYGSTFKAGDSLRFVVQNDDQWHDYDLIIRQSLGPGTRFRLDPAASTGQITVQGITVTSLPKIPAPPFEPPVPAQPMRRRAMEVSSGELTFKHYGSRLGNFELLIGNTGLAAGYQSELIGLVLDDQTEWLNLGNAPATLRASGPNDVTVEVKMSDSHGGTWQVTRRIRAGRLEGTLTVDMRVSVDQDREVILLPWITLYPGLGTYGAKKDQAIFAGLEYLANEPSSSQADITTADHLRRVPDPLKVTIPLMAIVHDDHFLGLIWEPAPWACATFDSPDRTTPADAHLMAITGPAVGQHRLENDLVAYRSRSLRAGQSISTTVTIIGGAGRSVVPAIEQYVRLRDIPDVPEVSGGFAGAVTLLSHGWLDSGIREGGLFRHALWQGRFRLSKAADAAMFMTWLSTSLSPDQNQMVRRLEETRDLALSEIPDHWDLTSAVSHLRPPTPSLVFGKIERLVSNAYQTATARLAKFNPDGTLTYRPGQPGQPGDTDYSVTHFANHANGHGARDLVSILEGATLSADPDLIQKALTLLDQQTRLYKNSVPRGAQTWEIPLHTPDIMASAHLVKCYCLGFLLSDREEYLEQARYWAWTGVPFIYLENPGPREVGLYATIPVLGATGWEGSWFGRPVQWCGMVYASALHLLSDYDPGGPWLHLAQGITASGLQQTFPTGDPIRQGLLPDFFLLRSQLRDGPAINPGTLQSHLPELFGQGTLYDIKKVPGRDWIIHAPCSVKDISVDPQGTVQFKLDGWGGLDRSASYSVLISGVERAPQRIQKVLSADGRRGTQDLNFRHVTLNRNIGYVIVDLAGPALVRVEP